MSELKPCPFCGGGAHLYAAPGPIDHQVECIRCHAKVKIYMNEQDAIKAWNTRAERTCLNSNNVMKSGELGFKCSVCGQWDELQRPNYCPNCGAKVVG